MPSPSPFRRAPHACLALIALAGPAGCSKPAPPRTMRVPVTVARVERRAVPFTLAASGVVEPVATADVGSQVGGVVTALAFREGDDVRAGQPLVELDARPFRAALAQAQAQLARDRAQAEVSRLEAERAARLFEQRLLSPADHDARRAAADAQAASVQADSAAVARARLELDYATIRAPFAGRTGRLNVHAGDYVKSGTAEPLVTVNQIRPIRVRFTVSEADQRAVAGARGGAVRVLVRAAAADTAEIEGRLAFVDNAVDAANGTLLLKGEFANDDGRLWPGQFVEVRLVLRVQPDALVIPAPAVSHGQQGAYVYVLGADSTASVRPVTLSHADDAIAVVASGLAAGETVVTDGQIRISPGARLVVREDRPRRRP